MQLSDDQLKSTVSYITNTRKQIDNSYLGVYESLGCSSLRRYILYDRSFFVKRSCIYLSLYKKITQTTKQDANITRSVNLVIRRVSLVQGRTINRSVIIAVNQSFSAVFKGTIKPEAGLQGSELDRKCFFKVSQQRWANISHIFQYRGQSSAPYFVYI